MEKAHKMLKVLASFGKVNIEISPKNFKVSVTIQTEKGRQAHFQEENESLQQALDVLVVKVWESARNDFIIWQGRAESLRNKIDKAKEKLKDIGEWDRLFHPNFKGEQDGQV